MSQIEITLKPRKALPFFSHHPWVYATAIERVTGMPVVGSEVRVRSHEGQFIAFGLFNPHSKIRVRLYSWDEQQPLTAEFWQARVRAAVSGRQRLFGDAPASKACRLVFSESDGLSGLIVDRFGDWLSLQWTSAALAQRQDVILPTLQELTQAQGVWLRTERGIKELEGLELEDGLLAGAAPPRPLFIEENGLKFEVDVQAGQKTGFYFDQRDNRSAFANLVRGGRVLDVCTYTGAFALAAAVHGKAAEIVAVDSSQAALTVAERNAELNGVTGKIRWECDDAFDFLEAQVQAGERYDCIVLDPPKLARTQGGLDRALKAYVRMNRLALQLLNPNGILCTCSCSGHVSRETFEQVLSRAALEANRRVQILEQRGQAADHPVSPHCVETSYLKCSLCRVE